MGELLDGPVRELAGAIRNLDISAEQLTKSFLDRIERVNPAINALVANNAEAAIKEALKADLEARKGEFRGPLHGVPFTIKDCLDTRDMVTTWGTQGRADCRPGADATVVSRLREAGGILLGKTNTPEFTLSFDTDNLLFGRTNNPYDLSRTPGGSSGGAAALLACSATPFDIGTDTGGSIRLPAHFCGICGIKPTTGRIPCTGNALPSSGVIAPLSQPGPMGRWVDDLAYLLPIIEGPDFIDPGAVPALLGDYREIDPTQLRIAYHDDNGVKTPSDEIKAAIRKVVKLLESHAVKATEARPTGIEMTHLINSRLFTIDGGMLVENLLDDSRTREPSPSINSFLKHQQQPPPDNREFAQLLNLWHNYQSSMLEFFHHFDVLLCPVNADAALNHDEKRDLSGYTYTSAFNLCGWPGTVVPTGLSDDGLPIGIQIVAAPFREDHSLAVAAWIESKLDRLPGPILQ